MIAAERAFGLKSTLEACELVDALGSSAVGEITITGVEGRRGAIFVERGRICWAGAHGLARRLDQLLQAGDRREALLHHTLESIDLLYDSPGGVKTHWAPRTGRGYEPLFTFGTAELLAYVGASTHEEEAKRARSVLEAAFEEIEWAAAFVRTPEYAFPKPIAVRGPAPPAKSMLRYGKWAASVLDMISTFADDPFLAVDREYPNKRTLVAFRHGEAVVAGETGAHGAARILNRRARERRQRGLHADL